MSSTETVTCDDEDTVQEFIFGGVYAGTIPQRNEDVRTVKRQPKRRGLWYACFAQPRVDEPADIFPARPTSSRLRLSTRQLEYRRTGSPDAKQLPLSDIRDVQYKWIEAGGVRVSKVTISLESGKGPVVIRGLKKPEDLVDAIRKRQLAPVDHGVKVPYEIIAGRSSVYGDTGKSGCSDVATAPMKHLTPRALFADATGSPGSAATSGCGSMTLLSAFARTPAQDFAGADSVAREIQLASPRLEDSSYNSSETGDTMDAALVKAAGARPGADASLTAPRATHVEKAAIEVIQAAVPPQQPTDSSVLPASVSLTDATTSSGASCLLPLPLQEVAISSPVTQQPSSKELAAGVLLGQPSSRCPLQPSLVIAGGNSQPLGRLPARIASGCSRDRIVLQGDSPPPRAEDSMVEGESESKLLQGFTHVQSILASCTRPSARPGDSVVHADNATPHLPHNSEFTAEGGNALSEAAPMSGLHTTHAVDGSKDALLQSTPPLVLVSGGESYDRLRSHPETGGCLEDANLTLQVGVDFCSILRDQSRELSLLAAGLGSSSSSAQTPRFLPALPKQQQRQLEGGRLAHSRMQPTVQPSSAGGRALDRVLVGPDGRLGDCSSYKSASSGGLADGSAGTSPAMSPLATALAHCRGAPIAALPTSGPISNAPEKKLAKSVGTLGIAAAAATVSAVLTSASLAGSASMTACPAATASTAAPPLSLSLLGMTAAAAFTLVAAAAVTHIRTGSPLRPLDPGPYDDNALEAQTLILSARNRDASSRSIEESPEPPLAIGNTLQIAKATSEVKLERTSGSPRQVAVVNGMLAAGGSADKGDEPLSTTGALVRGTRATATAGPASRSSCCGSNGTAGPCAPGGASASGGATGASGMSAGCGDSSEDAATSGAWGSQPALADLDPEQGTPAGHTAAPWLGLTKDQYPQSEAEDQPLPEMLFSRGLGAMPTLVRSLEEGTCPLQSSERHGGMEAEPGTTALYAYSRGATIEQSSRMESAVCQVSSATSASTGSNYTHQQKTEAATACDFSLHSPFQRAELAVAAVTVSAGDISPVPRVSQASRRPRELHLTESPVRVLYSMHASYMGPQAEEPQVHPSKLDTMLPTPASALPLLRTCDSAVQTDSPPAERAMQNKGSSFRGPGPSNGVMDHLGNRIANKPDSESESAPSQSLERDIIQPVCKLGSPAEYGEAPGAGAAAAAARERSTDSLPSSHASVHDLHFTDGSKLATGLAIDARRGPFESSPGRERRGAMASIAANAVIIPVAGQPDPTVTSQEISHRAWQQGVDPCALINVQVASLSRSGSESHLLSPSVSGTSGSVPLSTSVGSGVYMRMSSAVSSSDGLDPVVGTHTRLLAESTAISPLYSYRAEAAQPRGQGRSSLREGIDSGVAARSGPVDTQHGLLVPKITVSAKPPVPEPNCYTDFATPGRVRSPCVSNAQEEIHDKALEFGTVAVDPSSPINAGSDTADDMMWLLGPACVPWCSVASAAGSAPDSPRIPLPPPLATSRSGFGSSRCTTMEAAGSVKEKLEGCHSRASSNSSQRIAAGNLAMLEDRLRIAVCSAVIYREAQAGSCLDDNTPKQPLSIMDCASGSDSRAPGKGPELLLGGNVASNSNSKYAASNSARSVSDPSRDLLSAASGNRCDDGGEVATNSTPQTVNSMLHSDEASGASPVTPISPDLSDVSSSAYAGGLYPYVSPHRLQCPSVTHVEPGARLTNPVAASGDDLFHNPLYNAPSKGSADSEGPGRSQSHSEGGSGGIRLPEMAYSLGGSVNGGMNEDGHDTSTCASSIVPASPSQPSVRTASIGRRRTREDSATSSYWRDGVGSTSNSMGDQGTSAKEDWRLWVTAAAIKCLANSGRVCSPPEKALSSGSREWDVIGHNSSNLCHQPSKRARMVHPRSKAPSSAALQSQQHPLMLQPQPQNRMPVLLRGLVSPMMVLNPAYVQSVGGSPAFPSPRPSAAGVASVPRLERSRALMDVNMSSGGTLQRLNTPASATPRSQEQQQQYSGPPLRIGVFSSSLVVYPPSHAQSVGSPAATKSPPSVGSGMSAAVSGRHLEGGEPEEPELDTPPDARVQEQQQQHTGTLTRVTIMEALNRVLNLARTQSSPSSSSPEATSVQPNTGASVSTTEALQIGGNADTKADAIDASEEGLRAEWVVVQEAHGAEAELDEHNGEVGRHDSQQVTPRHRYLGQPQEAEWSSMQGSPSSQQAARAAALLRSANDAVDFARDAVQRGDTQWLSRVTATLQAVQLALDALREF